MANAVVWVDIPAKKLGRATRFYSAVLAAKIEVQDVGGGTKLAFLPMSPGEVAGCLYKAEGDVKPGKNGPMVYLNCDGRLDAALAEVEKAGGKVLQPAHSIGPHGFRAVILDSEGNRVALHSR